MIYFIYSQEEMVVQLEEMDIVEEEVGIYNQMKVAMEVVMGNLENALMVGLARETMSHHFHSRKNINSKLIR